MLKLIRNRKGATAIEYGLIAALIAVAIILALETLGTDISGIFGTVSTELQGAGTTGGTGGGGGTPAP